MNIPPLPIHPALRNLPVKTVQQSIEPCHTLQERAAKTEELVSISYQALEAAISVFDDLHFRLLAQAWRHEAYRNEKTARHLRSVAFAEMVYNSPRKMGARTQGAAAAVRAATCCLEVAAWLEQPSLSGESRIYWLLARTREKAQEARMLAG